MCPGPVEFVEPDLAGLLPISPPPDSGDKKDTGTAVNERTKRDGGGDYIHTISHFICDLYTLY